jgi:hypothetical protein
MKKIALIVVSVIIVVLLGMFITVAFFPNIYINTGKVKSFQDKINAKYEGLKLDLNAQTFKASYESGLFNKTHYKLKLRDVSVKVSGDFIKNHFPQDIVEKYSDIDSTSYVSLLVNKLNLIYGPFDKYLAVKDLRNIKLLSYNNSVEPNENVKGEIGKIKTNKINLSPLLEKSYNNLKDAYTDILINNPDYKIVVSSANLQLKNSNSKNNLNFSELAFNQKTSSEIAKLMNNMSDKDLEEVLKSGKEKQISNVTLNNATLKSVSDNESYNYAVNHFEFSSSFEPDKADFMAYRIALNIEDLKLSAEGNEKIVNKYSMLNGLDKLSGSFAIENITPKLAKNYMNLIKYSRGSNAGASNFQELAGHLSALMTSIKEAKPKILLDINPLKHSLIEAYVDGDLAFTENSNIPSGKIEVKTTSLDKLQNKLAESNLLNENSQKFINTIKGYLKKSEGNFYIATVEIKNQIPYIFINGQPLTGGQAQVPMSDNNSIPQMGGSQR